MIDLTLGDCIEVMAEMEADSIDAICTDPPYGLEFMSKEWDSPRAWMTGAGMSKPGLGDRPTAWPAFGGQKYGGANPTCATCGGRARGKKRCDCEAPDWKPTGPSRGSDGFRRTDNPADVGRDDVFGRTSAKAPEYSTGNGYTETPRWTSDHMGKGFDQLPNHFEAGPIFQQWCRVWATEAFRVAKPGAYLLAFGGTRTYHRLVCAIEDAGFEIRDSVDWLYGCHDDQTEALTARGWVNGLDLLPDDLVAQWSMDGVVSLVRPERIVSGPFDGQLIRFRNADIDQAVTPNHRICRQVSERTQVAGVRSSTWSDWQVDEARSINRWQRMRVPAAGAHNGVGIGGADYAALLGWVWAEGGFDLVGTGVRVYQSSTNQSFVDEIAHLFDRLGAHKRYDYQRMWKGRAYTATTWFFSGSLACRVRADLPGRTPTWDLLWRMTVEEKRALWDAAIKGDGSKGQRSFWQKDRASLEWAQALLAGIGCRGKIGADPRGVLYWSDRPTVELQRRHLADAALDYWGDVWCVTVPSGAFIVRRNGLVSVSGNSGFPKSLDASKAIDKALGTTAERTVTGVRPGHEDFVERTDDHSGGGRSEGWERPWQADPEAVARHHQQTAGGSPEAREWEGWGTALKPGHEPIVVARKPFVGTVAHNLMTNGVGALNIDGCRVTTTDNSYRRGGAGEFVQPAGRWPANVVLSHSEECVPVGTKKIKGITGTAAGRMTADYQSNVYGGYTGDSQRAGEPTGYADADGLETVAAYQCVEGCPVAELDRQSGVLVSGGTPPRRGPDHERNTFGDFTGQTTVTPGVGSSTGGASRFFYCAKTSRSERNAGLAGKNIHPTVKPVALMRWLCRLVTPPGGLVLDPFMGSGTTGIACLQENFSFFGIERDASYFAIAEARIAHVTENLSQQLF